MNNKYYYVLYVSGTLLSPLTFASENNRIVVRVLERCKSFLGEDTLFSLSLQYTTIYYNTLQSITIITLYGHLCNQ